MMSEGGAYLPLAPTCLAAIPLPCSPRTHPPCCAAEGTHVLCFKRLAACGTSPHTHPPCRAAEGTHVRCFKRLAACEYTYNQHSPAIPLLPDYHFRASQVYPGVGGGALDPRPCMHVGPL